MKTFMVHPYANWMFNSGIYFRWTHNISATGRWNVMWGQRVPALSVNQSPKSAWWPGPHHALQKKRRTYKHRTEHKWGHDTEDTDTFKNKGICVLILWTESLQTVIHNFSTFGPK